MDHDEPPNPDTLLQKVREGDENASDQLVQALYPKVRAVVRGHIRSVADHEDVMQEVFMKIFLKINQFEGRQPFEHWVSRVTLTTCYDWLRKRRVRPLSPFADLSIAEAEVVENSLRGDMAGDENLQREILTGLLDKLIAQLHPREQIVIRLLDLEERSVHDASNLTGWSPSKIKTTASRARRKLADHLQRLERRTQ